MKYKSRETGATIDGSLLTRVKVNGCLVFNPTPQQIEQAGYMVVAEEEEKEVKPSYKELIVEKIRERYDVDDEIAIIRQRDSNAENFEEYNEFVESCKASTKAELEAIEAAEAAEAAAKEARAAEEARIAMEFEEEPLDGNNDDEGDDDDD